MDVKTIAKKGAYNCLTTCPELNLLIAMYISAYLDANAYANNAVPVSLRDDEYYFATAQHWLDTTGKCVKAFVTDELTKRGVERG